MGALTEHPYSITISQRKTFNMNANIPTVNSPTKPIVKIIRFTVDNNSKKSRAPHKTAFEKMLENKYANYIVASKEDLRNATENLIKLKNILDY